MDGPLSGSDGRYLQAQRGWPAGRCRLSDASPVERVPCSGGTLHFLEHGLAPEEKASGPRLLTKPSGPLGTRSCSTQRHVRPLTARR